MSGLLQLWSARRAGGGRPRARRSTLWILAGSALVGGVLAGCGGDAPLEPDRVLLERFDASEAYPSGHFVVRAQNGANVEGAFELWIHTSESFDSGPGPRARLADGRLAPPVQGTLHQTEPTVVFEPRFPLRPGTWYEGVFTPRDGSPRTKRHFFPDPLELVAETHVELVTPSGDELPENLLRFHVHFSAPMRRGEAYQHVQLFDAAGSLVEGVFLPLEPELWDPTTTRITLLLDPGRIKRGLASLAEAGPNLREGEAYRLVVDPGWRDAAGASLVEGFEKRFTVTAPDRSSPDQEAWRITAGEAGSRDPLRVDFDEPLDHALLQRLLFVEDEAGAVVHGVPQVLPGETGWEWVPDAPWKAGGHRLVVSPLLEDRAGNGLAREFDAEVDEDVPVRETPEDQRLPFEVPPPTPQN